MNPDHVAIIMDGNRRWAALYNISVNGGHKKGAETLMKFCKNFKQYNIPYLTVYAFSSENNQRSAEEKERLFIMLEEYLDGDVKKLQKENISTQFIGDFSIFNKNIQGKIEEINALSLHQPYFTLTIALNYGGKQEVANALGKIINAELPATVENISQNLYSQLPDVDLLIRTGGSQRLSNFLMWQSTYAELYFCNCLWPEFNQAEFQTALEFYKHQKRNFGV